MDSAEIIEASRQTMSTVDDGIACAYLFVSQARGDARAASDVDVTIRS
jgi:predicted nucleotidyltransferase